MANRTADSTVCLTNGELAETNRSISEHFDIRSNVFCCISLERVEIGEKRKHTYTLLGRVNQHFLEKQKLLMMRMPSLSCTGLAYAKMRRQDVREWFRLSARNKLQCYKGISFRSCHIKRAIPADCGENFVPDPLQSDLDMVIGRGYLSTDKPAVGIRLRKGREK